MSGRLFPVGLDVRDLNRLEPGPRDVLFKIHDPEGRAVVREVMTDDDGYQAFRFPSPLRGCIAEAADIRHRIVPVSS